MKNLIFLKSLVKSHMQKSLRLSFFSILAKVICYTVQAYKQKVILANYLRTKEVLWVLETAAT